MLLVREIQNKTTEYANMVNRKHGHGQYTPGGRQPPSMSLLAPPTTASPLAARSIGNSTTLSSRPLPSTIGTPSLCSKLCPPLLRNLWCCACQSLSQPLLQLPVCTWVWCTCYTAHRQHTTRGRGEHTPTPPHIQSGKDTNNISSAARQQYTRPHHTHTAMHRCAPWQADYLPVPVQRPLS